MSQTIIEKLLKGAEVEWKPIDEIFTLRNGYTPSKSVKEYWIGGTVPWFRMEDLRAGERILTDSAQKVHINGVKGKLFPKDSIIMSTSATVGEHALILTDFLCNQRFTNFSVREKYKAFLDIKYVYYYFFVIDKKAQENTSISSFPSVQMDKLKKWMFPIPPLSVQKEIVRILDAFTAHTAELIAELNERKKQYNYYRNSLMIFCDNEVEWKTLGEIAEVYDGTHQTPRYTDVGIPFVSVENIKNLYSTKKRISLVDFEKYKIKPQIDDVFMTRIGDIGTCALVNNDKPIAYYVTLALIRANKKVILPKYLIHTIESNYGKTELYRRTLVNAVPIKINLSEISKFRIPILPLTEQQRIIDILDKFDVLTTSITEGLPREIELRNKQYEYYRNQLLNFSKLGNDAIKHSPTNV